MTTQRTRLEKVEAAIEAIEELKEELAHGLTLELTIALQQLKSMKAEAEQMEEE